MKQMQKSFRQASPVLMQKIEGRTPDLLCGMWCRLPSAGKYLRRLGGFTCQWQFLSQPKGGFLLETKTINWHHSFTFAKLYICIREMHINRSKSQCAVLQLCSFAACTWWKQMRRFSLLHRLRVAHGASSAWAKSKYNLVRFLEMDIWNGLSNRHIVSVSQGWPVFRSS